MNPLRRLKALFRQSPRRPLSRGLHLESLEGRITPANNLTIIPGTIGTGSLDSILTGSNGTILASDGGAADGSLSTGALESIGANHTISVTAQAAIAFNLGGTTLNLQTGAGFTDAFFAQNGAITFDSTTSVLAAVNSDGLTLQATTGIGTSANPVEIAVTHLTAQTSTGGIVASNTGNLSITGISESGGGNVVVSNVGAIDVIGALTAAGGNGNVTLVSSGDVSINAAVSTANTVTSPGTGTVTVTADADGNGAGDLTVTGSGSIASQTGAITLSGANTTIGGAISTTNGGGIGVVANGVSGDIQVNAPVSSSGGNGNLTFAATVDVQFAAAVSTSRSMVSPGAGTITVTADGDFSITAAGSASTQNGTISAVARNVTIGGGVTVTGGGNVTFSAGLNSFTTFTNQAAITTAGGNVTVRFDSQDLQAGSSITVAANREVNLRANTGGVGIDLGSAAVGLNFTQAELNTITGGQLRLTSAANVTLSQSITLASAQLPTLVIEAIGGVIDGTVGEQTDLTVDNLAFKVSTGIGAADDLNVAVHNLAFRNVTAGAVNVSNTGALTIASIFDVTTSTNSAAGAGNTTTITAASPITFAVNTTTTGDTTYTAGETNDPGTFADNLTVNTGVTVSVTAGNLTLQAGDDVTLNTGSTVTASGSVTITAGFNDLDNEGGLILNGTISGDPLSFSAINDIVVGAVTGGTVTITSARGGILDGNDGVTPGTLNITATSLTLNANQGIGVTKAVNPTIGATAAPLEVNVTTLTVSNSGAGAAGDIAVVDTTGGVSAGATNAATGGAISLTTLAGGTLTVSAANLSSTNGDITLTTDDIAFVGGGTVNAGTAAVTLQQQTNTFGFVVGTTGVNALIVADAELGQFTAGVVRLGRTTATGDFSIAEAVTGHTGFSTLTLRSGGTVTQAATIAVGTTNTGSLGVVSVGVVDLSSLNTVGTFAASVTGTGSTLSYTDLDDLTIGTVDGINGASTNNANLTVNSQTGNLTVTDTAAPSDVSSGTGVIFLVAGSGVTAKFTNSTGATIAATSGNIFVLADNMDLQTGGSITTSALVELRPNTGVAIDVGGADSAVTPTLGLTSAELNTITAAVLGIGVQGTAFDSGPITVTAAVAPTGTPTLRLRTSGTVTQTAGSTITAPNLRIDSTMSVTLAEGNDVDTLAATVTGTNQSFSFTDADGLAVSAVDTLLGVSTNAGAINIATTAGNLVVDQAISAGAATIDLAVGGGVTGGGSITGANVRIGAAGPVGLTGANQIGTLAANVTGMGSAFALNNGTALAINVVGGASGITTNGGAISVTNTGSVTVNQDVNAGTGAVTIAAGGSGSLLTNAARIRGSSAALTGDRMALQTGSTVQVGTTTANVVTLNADTAGRLIDLGSATDAAANTLELSGAEIDTITAGVLRIGSTAAGNVTFTNAIAPLNASALSITTGGAITGNSTTGPDVSATSLALRAANGIATSVSLPLRVQTATLQAAVTGAGDVNVFNTSGAVALNGVSAANGNVNVSTAETAGSDILSVTAGTTISASGSVTLGGADGINLPATAAITAGTMVALNVGTTGADSDGSTSTLAGAISGSGAKIQGGAGNDVINLTPSANVAIDVIGGDPMPPASPGDTLNIDTSGATAVTLSSATGASGLSGTGTFGNRKDVTFSQIEALSPTAPIPAPTPPKYLNPALGDRSAAFTGLSTQQHFVQALYLDALGRAGSGAELNGYLPALSAPNGAFVVAQAIENSPEGRDNLVKGWYRTYLGRSAVGGEEMGFVRALLAGASEELMLGSILGSPEFFARAQTLISSGTPQERFVQALYNLLLDRTAGTGEIAGNVAVLTGGQTQTQVATNFLRSQEFRTDLVVLYYGTLLHRTASATEVSGWVNSGLDANAIRLAFESSPEFFISG